jgi:dolichol-phosphate mannosyltransferase
LVAGVVQALQPRSEHLEFVLVSDASADDWEVIARLAGGQAAPGVRGLLLAHPAGQHSAIAVGLRAARGATVVVMDGDLQHRPADVPALLDALADVDVAIAARRSRSEGALVRAGSRAFFALLSAVLGQRLDPALSSFSALRRSVVERLPHERGGPRHHLLEAGRIGVRWRAVPVEFPPRRQGASAYSWSRRARLALDLLAVARPGLSIWIPRVALGSLGAVGVLLGVVGVFGTGGAARGDDHLLAHALPAILGIASLVGVVSAVAAVRRHRAAGRGQALPLVLARTPERSG